MLVDDEPWALKSLKYLLDWEKLGYTIAGEATNGQQAMDMFLGNPYSLIITDMKMPIVNGLEFISKIRLSSNVPIIIMSGYEDFGYVKNALAFGVKDYLLKPVEASDLERVLISVDGELNQTRVLDKKLYHGIPAMKERLAKEWANGYANAKDVTERLMLLSIPVRQELGICCLLAELDLDAGGDSALTDVELQTKRFASRNVMEEVLGSVGVVFEDSDLRYGIVLFSQSAKQERSEVLALAEQLKQYTAQFAKIGITIGVGRIVYAIQETADSFAESKLMLDQQFFFGKRMVIAAERLMPKADETRPYDWHDILNAIETGDIEQLRTNLENKWTTFVSEQLSPTIMKSMIMTLFISFFRLVREQGGDYEELFDPKWQDYEKIIEARTLHELFEITWKKYKETAELLRKSNRPTEGAIDTVKRLVRESYKENLSMRNIASKVYMNAAYLGQLFKVETGMGFNEYLFQVRMDNAKRMLLHTDMKVYEIATAVGYSDLDWFYKKFKQHTGFNSSEYRLRKHL